MPIFHVLMYEGEYVVVEDPSEPMFKDYKKVNVVEANCAMDVVRALNKKVKCKK